MTYVEQQTSTEIRSHMRALKKMHGWHEPLADRLFREVEVQDAEIARLTPYVEAFRREKTRADRAGQEIDDLNATLDAKDAEYKIRTESDSRLIDNLEAEIAKLRAALEPFQRNVGSISLSGALGHIGREDLWSARHAYALEQRAPQGKE